MNFIHSWIIWKFSAIIVESVCIICGDNSTGSDKSHSELITLHSSYFCVSNGLINGTIEASLAEFRNVVRFKHSFLVGFVSLLRNLLTQTIYESRAIHTQWNNASKISPIIVPCKRIKWNLTHKLKDRYVYVVIFVGCERNDSLSH